MRCPYCGSISTRVVDSRPSEDYSTIRRRRACEDCGRRFTTYEKVETVPLVVVKKDKTREMFDRDKMAERVMRACNKRPVSPHQIDVMADEIEALIRTTHENEVTTEEIGELVMEQLAKIDQVAYIRYLSVYHEFENVDDFIRVVQELKNKGEV